MPTIESAPKQKMGEPRIRVILFCNEWVFGYWNPHYETWEEEGGRSFFNPTHWLPVPDSPVSAKTPNAKLLEAVAELDAVGCGQRPPFGTKEATVRIPTNEQVNNQKIRCYDNNGQTLDQFTVVYMGQPEFNPGTFACACMNSAPFHPQGIGMHAAALPGRHLGKRTLFKDLPEDCQSLVRQDLA